MVHQGGHFWHTLKFYYLWILGSNSVQFYLDISSFLSMYQFSVFASRVELDVDNTDTDEACDSSFEEGNFSTKIEFVEKFYPLPSSYFTPRSILHFTLWESSSRPQNSSFSHQTCTKHKFTINDWFWNCSVAFFIKTKYSCQIGNGPNTIANWNFDHLLTLI